MKLLSMGPRTTKMCRRISRIKDGICEDLVEICSCLLLLVNISFIEVLFYELASDCLKRKAMKTNKMIEITRNTNRMIIRRYLICSSIY